MSEIKDSLTFLVIGPKNSGKTVFLVSIGECPNVIKSKETVRELQKLAKRLEEGQTLSPTNAGIATLKFKFKYRADRGGVLKINLPDYDGQFVENLSDGYNSRSPDSGIPASLAGAKRPAPESGAASPAIQSAKDQIKQLHQLIEEADGFILLMPVGDESQEAMKKLKEMIDSFMELAGTIYKSRGLGTPPLVVAVNKWDRAPCFQAAKEEQDAENYIQSNKVYKYIYGKLKNFFSNVAIMPISAYGHRVKGNAPEPGNFNPYRVTEPVVCLINQYFKTLEKNVDDLLAAKSCLEAAEILMETGPLWKNWPSGNFTGLLRESLHGCYVNLTDRLKVARTLGQYEQAWKKWPESALFDYYTPAQQEEIEKLREALIREARRKKTKHRGRVVGWLGAAAVIAVVWFGGWNMWQFGQTFKNRYAEVINADLQNQYPLLNGFLRKYDSSLRAKLVYGSELEAVRQKRQNLETSAQEKVQADLAELENMGDSCARAVEAAHLRDFAQSMGENISSATSARLENMLKHSKELCAAKSAIATAVEKKELDALWAQLADKPETPEVVELKNKLLEKMEEEETRTSEASEKARLEELENEMEYIERVHSLARARRFVAKYKHDFNSRVREMAISLEERLPAVLHGQMLGLLGRISGLDEAFPELHELWLANRPFIRLNEAQQASLRSRLRALAIKSDWNAISKIPAKIHSPRELEPALEKINTLRVPHAYILDGGLFEYERPQRLARELEKRAENLEGCREALENGISVKWEVLASSANVLGLACEKKIGRDGALEISLTGKRSNVVHELKHCRRLPDNRGYVFNTEGLAMPWAGELELRKSARGGRDKICRAHINITGADIIKLYNDEYAHFNLDEYCRGLRLDLIPAQAF